MSISFEEVKKNKKVLPFSAAFDILNTTEPLASYEFSTQGEEGKVQFDIPQDWNAPSVDIQSKPADYVTPATFSIPNGPKVKLTKEALLTATSSIGLNPAFTQKTPSPMIQAALTYWANNGGMGSGTSMKVLVDDRNVGVAFTRPSLNSFSNVELIQVIAQKLADKYGVSVDDLYVDYKFGHTLQATTLRLIVPEVFKTIDSGRSSADKPDEWSLGLQFTNSLTGDSKHPLSISGYLFAWWCTNGAISEHATSGNYSRKTSGQDFDIVKEWAEFSTDQILEFLPADLDEVEALTTVPLEGELSATVYDIFDHYKVPNNARQGIMDSLVNSDDISGYGLLSAITESANRPDWPDRTAKAVMEIGGALPHVLSSRCDACHRLQE